jgi:hypothetical protein
MHTADHGRSQVAAIVVAAPFDAALAPATGDTAAMDSRIAEAVFSLLYPGIFEPHALTGAWTRKTFD